MPIPTGFFASSFLAVGIALAVPVGAAPPAADQQQVIEAVRSMYVAATNDDLDRFRTVTTPDFYAFELGKRLTGDELMGLIKDAHAAGKVYVWEVTEPEVRIEGGTGWITYVNRGSVQDASGKQPQSWLESAVLRKQDDTWRIHFFHSTRVPAATPATTGIVGTWLLESIVDTLADGSRAYWMGQRPTGAIVYSASGHMSVQFMRDPRPMLGAGPAGAEDAAKLAGADPFATAGAAELRDLVRGYYAYFGRYKVSDSGDAITHFVETSLRPNEVGVSYQRAIRLEGNQLFISLAAEVNGVPRHRVLTWRRAP